MMLFYLRSAVARSLGIYLMVNVKNTGTYMSCIRGGWSDTGEKYILGLTRLQHILWMPMQ